MSSVCSVFEYPSPNRRIFDFPFGRRPLVLCYLCYLCYLWEKKRFVFEKISVVRINQSVVSMNIERHAPGHVSRATKVRRALWNVTAAVLFRPFVTPLFSRWRVAVLRLFGAQVAWDAQVYASARVWAPWRLRMGHRACLGPDVVCYNQDWVVLDDDAVVSQYSYLCTAGHEVDRANTASSGLVTAAIVVRRGAWVGSRAYVGMGVEIGEGAVVGATASVYKNVEPWAVVGGNPAKIIKMRKITKPISGGVNRSEERRGKSEELIVKSEELRSLRAACKYRESGERRAA